MRGHIRRRGARSWEIKHDTDRNGGQRQTVYKSFKGTRKEAEAELARLLARAAGGGHVNPSKLTVAEYLRERIAHWRAMGTISPKTEERYRELVEHQVVPFLGARFVQKLTPRDIESWHARLLVGGRKGGQRGVSARTVGHAHRIVAKAMREGLRHELVPRNVCAAEPAPRVKPEEMRILTPQRVAELPALLGDDELAVPALTATFVGLRRGEILALRWGRIDLEGKLLEVRESLEETAEGLRFKPPKTKAGIRDIKLPDIVVEALRAHRKRLLERRLLLGQGKLGDNDLVFPALDGSPQHPRVFSVAWLRLARRLGLEVSFHELRHTHASQLIDAGVDVVTISKRLGHGSPAITLSTYAHLFRKDDSKAADAINAAFKAAP
jgi:integrase